MPEISINVDARDMNTSEVEKFKEIKPVEGMSVVEANNFWNEKFDKVGLSDDNLDQTETTESTENPKQETIDGITYYYDDNGDLYRVGNELVPNAEYEVNGYKYTTDEQSRIISSEGKLQTRDPDYKRYMEQVRDYESQDYRETDDGGHLIGHQFGGSDRIENLVPQDSKINQNDYINLEMELANEVNPPNNKEVYVTVEPIYDEDSNRPVKETEDNNAGERNDTNESLEDEKKVEDSGNVVRSSDEISESDNPEDKTKKFLERLTEILTSSEEIKKLIEQNPDLKEKIEKCLDIINNPDKHTATEINWAMDRIKKEIKGAIFEAAVKDALASIGLDVENGQRTVEGESGATRPDVIASNNTDKPIILFGKVINPGENVYVECKCGRKEYMEGQLKNHLPNQLSGHNGVSILITTSDMDEVDNNLLNDVIKKNDTTTVIIESSAEDIEDVIKEAN